MYYYNNLDFWDNLCIIIQRYNYILYHSCNPQHTLSPELYIDLYIFNLLREVLLATSNRKSKNVWMELLQEQNPDLLPPHHENESAKPAYIQRMRLEKAQRESAHLVISDLPGSHHEGQAAGADKSATGCSLSLPGSSLMSTSHSLHQKSLNPSTSDSAVPPVLVTPVQMLWSSDQASTEPIPPPPPAGPVQLTVSSLSISSSDHSL